MQLNNALFQLNNVTALGEEEYLYSKAGGDLFVTGRQGVFAGAAIGDYKYFSFDVDNHEECSVTFHVSFWLEGNDTDVCDLYVTMGCLPLYKTKLCFPLEALSGNQLFYPRTPVKLKTVVKGNRIDVTKINKIALVMHEAHKDLHVGIRNICMTKEEPEYFVSDDKLVDALGQHIQRQWPGKLEGPAQLCDDLQTEWERAKAYLNDREDGFLGDTSGPRFEATGFYRTQFDGQRYWLVTPDGYPFISSGIDCIGTQTSSYVKDLEGLYEWLPSPDDPVYGSCYQPLRRYNTGEQVENGMFSFVKANLLRAFGDDWFDAWCDITKYRLLKWGFNTVAAWSQSEFIQRSSLPYVLMMSGFPTTEKKIFRDFPDVFSDEYAANAQTFAKELEAHVGNPYFIGYFMRNEPAWAFVDNLNVGYEIVRSQGDFASKDQLIRFLQERYAGDIARLNDEWGTALADFDAARYMGAFPVISPAGMEVLDDFSKVMMAKYISVPALACRAVDPDHLNLGMRYAFISGDNLFSGSEYFDVFSINCYYNSCAEDVANIYQKVKLPVVIGEFHFGSLDRGLPATGIRGASSQEERIKAIAYYVEQAAACPYFLGAHYFEYNDQSILGRSDGENYNIGVVDVCNQPHKEVVEGYRRIHDRMYAIARGEVQPFDGPVDYIPPIFY